MTLIDSLHTANKLSIAKSRHGNKCGGRLNHLPFCFLSIPLSYMNTYTIAMHQKKYEKTNAFF